MKTTFKIVLFFLFAFNQTIAQIPQSWNEKEINEYLDSYFTEKDKETFRNTSEFELNRLVENYNKVILDWWGNKNYKSVISKAKKAQINNPELLAEIVLIGYWCFTHQLNFSYEKEIEFRNNVKQAANDQNKLSAIYRDRFIYEIEKRTLHIPQIGSYLDKYAWKEEFYFMPNATFIPYKNGVIISSISEEEKQDRYKKQPRYYYYSFDTFDVYSINFSGFREIKEIHSFGNKILVIAGETEHPFQILENGKYSILTNNCLNCPNQELPFDKFISFFSDENNLFLLASDGIYELKDSIWNQKLSFDESYKSKVFAEFMNSVSPKHVDLLQVKIKGNRLCMKHRDNVLCYDFETGKWINFFEGLNFEYFSLLKPQQFELDEQGVIYVLAPFDFSPLGIFKYDNIAVRNLRMKIQDGSNRYEMFNRPGCVRVFNNKQYVLTENGVHVFSDHQISAKFLLDSKIEYQFYAYDLFMIDEDNYLFSSQNGGVVHVTMNKHVRHLDKHITQLKAIDLMDLEKLHQIKYLTPKQKSVRNE
jgi:hypothetical protein